MNPNRVAEKPDATTLELVLALDHLDSDLFGSVSAWSNADRVRIMREPDSDEKRRRDRKAQQELEGMLSDLSNKHTSNIRRRLLDRLSEQGVRFIHPDQLRVASGLAQLIRTVREMGRSRIAPQLRSQCREIVERSISELNAAGVKMEIPKNLA